MKHYYKWTKVQNESIYNIEYVKSSDGTFVHIATCTDRLWAEQIVIALNQMEMEVYEWYKHSINFTKTEVRDESTNNNS